MYRHDYILRMIEQLARTLSALRDRLLRREISSEEVRAELQQVARDAGFDLDLARRLDPAMLLGWLTPTQEAHEPKLWLMAELLYLDALEARAAGEPGAGGVGLRQALMLFSQLPPDWTPSADRASASERVTELEQLLNP